MDVRRIRGVGRALPRFLEEFDDCFGRCDTRRYLRVYADGQTSELHRKSVEPMALRAGVPPRSLQAFLSFLEWDEDRLVDRLQQTVARDHAQTYVAEVPCTFCGWAQEPAVLVRRTPQEMRRKGKRRRFPRLSRTAAPVSEARNLLHHSPAFQGQDWAPIHIKNGEKGAIVREVKAVRFFMRRDGLPTRAHWLMVTRDPPGGELKFFVSNASAGVPLEWLLYVAYSRWPIEQCFREEKDELGFDHFEVRSWRSIHRHMYLSQVSHLFMNKMRQQLVAEESAANRPAPVGADDFSPGDQGAAAVSPREPDRRPGPLRAVPVAPEPSLGPTCTSHSTRRRRRADRPSPPPQHRGQAQPHTNDEKNSDEIRNQCRPNQIVLGE